MGQFIVRESLEPHNTMRGFIGKKQYATMPHAVVVVLMEHGLTLSAIATRLVYMSAPENLQSAVAAGLLALSSSFVGTMENCSRLLDRISADVASAAAAETLEIPCHYKGLKSPVPGFGHHLHKPVHPHAYKLLDMARAEAELNGDKVRALETLAKAVDTVAGRTITINATGAVAALLGEIGVPTGVMRGFAVIVTSLHRAPRLPRRRRAAKSPGWSTTPESYVQPALTQPPEPTCRQ